MLQVDREAEAEGSDRDLQGVDEGAVRGRRVQPVGQPVRAC